MLLSILIHVSLLYSSVVELSLLVELLHKVNMYSTVLLIGTEQEWKLAQCTVEAAPHGLYTATNELCIASLKAKSASGRACHLGYCKCIHWISYMHNAYACFLSMLMYQHCGCVCVDLAFFNCS